MHVLGKCIIEVYAYTYSLEHANMHVLGKCSKTHIIAKCFVAQLSPSSVFNGDVPSSNLPTLIYRIIKKHINELA